MSTFTITYVINERTDNFHVHTFMHSNDSQPLIYIFDTIVLICIGYYSALDYRHATGTVGMNKANIIIIVILISNFQ